MFPSSFIRNACSNVIGLVRPSRLTLLATLLLGGLSLNSCSTFENEEVKPADATATADAYDFNPKTTRGINIQFSYYLDDSRFKNIDFKKIRSEGFTAVRIEIDPTRVDVNDDTSSKGFKRVTDYLREARRAGLDVVLTYHNGNYMQYNSPNDGGGEAAGRWWAKAIPKLNRTGNAYTINIINEWGVGKNRQNNQPFADGPKKWFDGTQKAINMIYDAGYHKDDLIIDAGLYANETGYLEKYGNSFNRKGYRLIYSVHIYPNTGMTKAKLTALSNKFANRSEYGLVVGEYGSKFGENPTATNSAQGNAWKKQVEPLVQEALNKGFGAFGWCWLGDGKFSDSRNSNNLKGYMNTHVDPDYLNWIQKTLRIR